MAELNKKTIGDLTPASSLSDSDMIAVETSTETKSSLISKVWDYIKSKLGISSSGSTGKYLNEQGTFSVPPDNNTTYTLSVDGNSIKLTPSSGSANTITVPYADDAIRLKTYETRPTSANVQFSDGRLRTFKATSSMTEGKPTTGTGDAHIIHMAWDNPGGFDGEIAVGIRSSGLQFRSQDSGTWGDWKTVIDTSNIGSQLPIVDLGTSYTAELKSDISSGTFKKAVVGGKLTINNHVYYLAHPDYWYNTGDTRCTTHHMLVVPASILVTGQMNSTNTTTGAYVGSDFKTGANGNTALADIKAIIKADFGAANILTHRELFANATSNGRPSAGAWYDSDIDLMNESMVFGGDIFSPHSDGTNLPAKYTIDKTQIKLFAERPDLITIRAHWWVRDPENAETFGYIHTSGYAGYGNASGPHVILPAFGIC